MTLKKGQLWVREYDKEHYFHGASVGVLLVSDTTLFVLWDTRTESLAGTSGKIHDWSLARHHDDSTVWTLARDV